MKYIPNMLSLLRIPLSIVVFAMALQQRWELATVLFLVALATDAADGYVARRFGAESTFGADVLEPVCDMTLSVAAVAGLYFGDVIPLWIPLVLILVVALLQLSHNTRFEWIKRHTHYIHPLFFLLVIYFVGVIYLMQTMDLSSTGMDAVLGVGLLWTYNGAWIAATVLKWSHVEAWTAKPV